jgi:cyclic-di-GMP-binding protein
MSSGIIGADQRPAFTNAEQCRAWLATTPLGNAVQAQAQLLRQMNLLNRERIAESERLAILELLRKPLLLVQEEGSRRYTGKSLPLVPPEQAAFDATQALWQVQLAGYGRCIEAAIAGDTALKPHLALAIQRALDTLAAVQFDIYRAGFQPAPEHWRTLHELYHIAEEARLTEAEVEDRLRHGKQPTSPRSAYVEVLLLHAASPHELPLRHLIWVARWARRWSAKVNLLAAAPATDSPTKPLCVDLAATEPAGYSVPDGAKAPRWLDTTGLRPSLKKRLSLLEKGALPADLQLGDDCVQPACGKLLKKTYRRWCKGGIGRGYERQAVSGTCELIAGIEAIHYYLSGRKSFRQPGFADDDALRREREEMATFGRVGSHHPDGFTHQHGYRVEEWRVIEEWQMADESATGVHITHAIVPGGARVGPGQLVALRPADTPSLLLGCLRWAMVTIDGQLHAGVLVIPGQPEPIAIRTAVAAGSATDAYRPGFLLPAIAALGSTASVILPPGAFKSGRVVEITTNKGQQRLRLSQLLDRGPDFDRADYEAA